MADFNSSQRAIEMVDELSTASTEHDFLSIATRTARQLGFRYFSYFGFELTEPLLLSTYPRLWTGRYLAQNYQRIDPVIRRSRVARQGFYWDATLPSEPLTRSQRQFFSEALDFGIRNGVTIPIHVGFGQVAALTLAGDEQARDFSAYVHEALDDLHFIALSYQFHARANFHYKLEDGDAPLLTQRELQCLTWLASGKTMSETGAILNISERTVRFHLDNVKAKLSVSTVAGAVHEAAQRGLLPL
jgi:LuxR family transcriptional regulator, activator of conjugal transfer of Ti plasmids